MENSLEQIKKRWDALEVRHEVLVKEKVRLIGKIDEVQQKMDDAPNILSALELLQKKVSEENRVLYENLLTNLLHEILPFTRENGERIVFKTQLKQNRMNLDIDILTENNETRNVFLDKGGSVHNVIAMGLRLIALSVSQSRRFVVFDEADCWLRSEYVPAFTRMLTQLAKQVGMQIVYISHHPESCFTGSADRVLLARQNNQIVVSQKRASNEMNIGLDGNLAQTDESWLDGVGLRFIRLKNIKQHTYSEINLSSGVTLISGDNDVGKSTIIQAFEAIKNNNGRAGLIRDGANTAEVEIGLEDDMLLSWRYRRNGSKKSRYQLIDKEGNILSETYQGNGVPDWVRQCLAMESFSNWDLHISEQSQSAFILDRKFTGSQRAEILSLNRNDQIAQIMLKKYRDEITENKRTKKYLDEQLKAIKKMLSVIRPFWTTEGIMNSCSQRSAKIMTDKEKLENLSKLIARIESTKKKTRLYQQINSLEISKNKSNPANIKTTELFETGKRWKYLSDKEKTYLGIKNIESINPPKLTSDNQLLELGKNWSVLKNKCSVLEKVSSIEVPQSVKNIDSSNLLKLLKNIEIKDGQSIALIKKQSKESEGLEVTKSNLKKVWTELGNVCPTCHQINNGGEYHAH